MITIKAGLNLLVLFFEGFAQALHVAHAARALAFVLIGIDEFGCFKRIEFIGSSRAVGVGSVLGQDLFGSCCVRKGLI